MADKKTFSVRQFLEAQKGAKSFSALLKAYQELDVASLEEEDQVALAKALRDVAKTKNGPMLVLSLPGSWQAMLALVEMEMPGQDRLAFRGILPRQVVGYLAKHPESPLFAGYPFAQVGKADWAYYLERAKELIEPCKRFLEKAEAEGGFGHGELVEIAKKTELVVPYLKLEEMTFREVYELYVCGTGAALWEKLSFATLKKDEWEIILGNSKIEIPAAFDEVLKNGMFTREELCRYAETNRKIIPYLQPSEVDVRWAVEWLVENKDAALWETYDFGRFDDEQIVALVGRSEERGVWPKEIVERVNAFSDEKILELAKKNVINVIGILEVERIVGAGEKFFGELCEVIAWQQGIVQVVIDKLSIGEKPWLKLPRSFLVILLKAVPWGRKFVSWQDFEMKEIDELAKADESFYKALPMGGKILLNLWRHRVGIIIGAIICVILFCWGLKEYYANVEHFESAAREHAEQARREVEERAKRERAEQEMDGWEQAMREVEERAKRERAEQERKEREARNKVEQLIANVNASRDYAALYEAVKKLQNYEIADSRNFRDCSNVYPYRMARPSEVECYSFVYKFVGFIRIDLSRPNSVLFNWVEGIGSATELYCIEWFKRDGIRIAKCFDVINGRPHKLKGFDYSKCQGLGLFIRK